MCEIGNSPQRHFWDLETRDVQAIVPIFTCAQALINQGRCTMSALLILNLQHSGKYTLSPKEGCRSATELIMCGHCFGTWTFHSVFSNFFLLEWLQQGMQKKAEGVCVWVCVCVWVRWPAFKRVINGDWFCVCVCVCAGHKHSLLPPTLSVHSPLSLWCFGEGFISPPPTLSPQWKEEGISAPHLLLRLLWHTVGSQPQYKVDVNLSHSHYMVVLSFNLCQTLCSPLEWSCIQFLYVPLKRIKPAWNVFLFFFRHLLTAFLKASLWNILMLRDDCGRFGATLSKSFFRTTTAAWCDAGWNLQTEK